jgi:hypothetical protein
VARLAASELLEGVAAAPLVDAALGALRDMAPAGAGSPDKAFAELTIGKHQTANNVAKTAALRILFMPPPAVVIHKRR